MLAPGAGKLQADLLENFRLDRDVAAESLLRTLGWPPPLPNLPTLFSDETLYSWAGFAYARNGVTDVREFSRRLFGSPYTALLHDFPANLNAYFSDRGRLFQADRGRRIGVAVAALGKRAGTGLTVAESSTISLKRAAVGRVSESVLGLTLNPAVAHA